MTTLARAVRFDADSLWVHLDDGRVIGAPLAWFPRLLAAGDVERGQFDISPMGIHWNAIDEDISVAGLLAGRGDLTVGTATASA